MMEHGGWQGDPGEGWPFHRLEPRQFEQLAATVLEDKYSIELLSFSLGRDGGRDASARKASIQLDSTVIAKSNLKQVSESLPNQQASETQPNLLDQMSPQRDQGQDASFQNTSFRGNDDTLGKLNSTTELNDTVTESQLRLPEPPSSSTFNHHELPTLSQSRRLERATSRTLPKKPRLVRIRDRIAKDDGKTRNETQVNDPAVLDEFESEREEVSTKKRVVGQERPSRLVRMRDVRVGQRKVTRLSRSDSSGCKILHNQNIVLQAKHTKRPNITLDDGLRNMLFKPEVEKVRKLVSTDQCDIYIVALNYSVPAGQEGKIVEAFRAVGVGHVIVVGKETLERWIQQSPSLCSRIPDMYGIGGLGVRQISLTTATGVNTIQKDLQGVLNSLQDTHTVTGERLCQLSHQQSVTLSQLGESQALLHEVRQEVLSNKHGRPPPLRSMSRGMEEMKTRMKELTQGVHTTARAVDAIRRRMDYTPVGIQRDFPGLTPMAPGGKKFQFISLTPEGATTQQASYTKHVTDLAVSSSPPDVSNSLLLQLVSHYGVIQSWRFLLRYLGVSETQIAEVTAAHVSPREQAYSGLTSWRDNTPPGGSREKLEEALRACALNAPADDIFNTQRPRGDL